MASEKQISANRRNGAKSPGPKTQNGNPKGRVAEHIRKVGEAQACTSIIVAAELRYGATKKESSRLWQSPLWWCVGVLVTQIWVIVAWIFFRAMRFGDAIAFISSVFRYREAVNGRFSAFWIVVLILVWVDIVCGGRGRRSWTMIGVPDRLIFWSATGALFALTLFVSPTTHKQFIYFNF